MEGLFLNWHSNILLNALQELREENKKLKIEIDVHSVTMENLRKGYLCFAVEFRALHDNYAAQLESARAEICVMTQSISQLIAEKKILLKNLNAVKKRKYVKKNNKHYVKNSCWMNYHRNKEDYVEQNNDDINL